MLPARSPTVYQTPKCFVTYATLGHVDSNQSSHKRRPWSVLRSLGFIHQIDLILPQECAAALRAKLLERQMPTYSRVNMTLGQVLEKDFFTSYVKEGNVLMLSKGNKAVDDMFTLQNGTLTMYLGKETYEKAGLVGKPYGAKGNRKTKPRWVVTYNLQSASMVHGKRGFDRLLYACQQVFDQPLTWLFCNVHPTTPQPDPLQKHSPSITTASPMIEDNLNLNKVPLLIDQAIIADGDRSGLEESASELYEWLSLVRLGSPRVRRGDNIDPYLSRYEAPGDLDESMPVCKITFRGFLSSIWLHDVAMDVMAALPPQSWFSLAATELSTSMFGAAREVTLLRPDQVKDEYLMWEINSSE